MKSIKAFAVIALFFAVNTLSSQSVTDKWPAIKTFHEVMSRSFHPAEEGNLAPLKNFSETLMNKAQELTKSEIPAEFKTKAMLNSIDRLQRKTVEVHKLVLSQGSDTDLTKAITEAHDIFHEIVGLCSGEKH